jgi:hypothetical protein
MVAYSILVLLPLTHLIKEAFQAVDQPWYANDAGAGAKLAGIQAYFKSLQVEGPKHGYIPEPSKSIMIVKEHNHEKAEIYFKDLGFTVITSSPTSEASLEKYPTSNL